MRSGPDMIAETTQHPDGHAFALFCPFLVTAEAAVHCRIYNLTIILRASLSVPTRGLAQHSAVATCKVHFTDRMASAGELARVRLPMGPRWTFLIFCASRQQFTREIFGARALAD